MIRIFVVFPVLLLLLFSVGCNSYEGDFVVKTEKELAAMEKLNLKANKAFRNGDYKQAEEILNQLTAERTVSQPQYQMELISVLLLGGKYDEAHQLMLKLHQSIETLVDVKLEEKAQSVWHGEVNKVYKGDSYERSSFYALMALSFIRQENYEDALRCVKNGLLAEADANDKNSFEDYGFLHYLGYVACSKMNDTAAAEEYLRAMYKGLGPRGFFAEDPDGKKNLNHCFEQLKKADNNVFLVVWTGMPPEVVCTGEYKEKRSIIKGKNVFDMMSIAVSVKQPFVMPNNLGDLNYQATTRGGRMMDDVLADKAAAKAAMEISRNIFFIAGLGLVTAGGYCMNSGVDLPIGLSLLGAGLGCYIVGGTVHVVGSLMNPEADARFWHNIPSQFYIVPLSLPAGQHQIMLTGYSRFDAVAVSFFNINIPSDRKNHVIHLAMQQPEWSIRELRAEQKSAELDEILSKADENRLQKEIK